MHEKWNLQTYCDILGVSENSPQYEIHAAYKKAKNIYSLNNPEILNQFTQEEALALENLVEEAFAILGNHSLRSIYQRKNEAQDSNIRNHQPSNNANSLIKPEYNVDLNFEEQINNLKVFNGENLRLIREYKGISLSQLSEQTKVKSTYLTAIEASDFASLPASVYTRGFLKQIAKVLELPVNEVASSYLGLYNKQDVGA